MTTATNNSITGISTDSFQNTDVITKQYVDNVYTLPTQTGNSGKFLTTTDGTTQSWNYVGNYQEFTSAGSQTFTLPVSSFTELYIEAIGAGGGGGAGTINSSSGAGGGAGSYTSWYIPVSIVSSNLTVIVGSGGTGGTASGQAGSVGSATTITWTGPAGTYKLITYGGGPGVTAGPSPLLTDGANSFYTTVGGTGAAASAAAGTVATAQANRYQATGGGSGGYNANAGGAGGTITIYGSTTSASGGTNAGTNGSSAIAITGLPYGGGGGGGGASASVSGNGGNGVRGGGGGGGGANPSNFGNGGNGGDGYVKITWW